MPKSSIRLSAGRKEFSQEAQAFMFLAGANSIFTGDKLLTTANPEFSDDAEMFKVLGLKGKAPFTGNTAQFRPAWAPTPEAEESMEATAPEAAPVASDIPAQGFGAFPQVAGQPRPRAAAW